ncbi:DegV family protein [Alloiococcus sp. CFN-8]|uniref:DegV family protein n=1 Tax=Alloiococcus sp. CFN-8 TaxID=3416081 RepID=UPI003CF43758
MEKTGYRIVTDSSADLTLEEASEKNITVVPFYISLDSKEYLKEVVELEIRELYEKMVQDPYLFPKTSTPSVQDYIDAFLPIVQNEMDIICICISQGFSSSYQSAINAQKLVLEEYPHRRITVIDSSVATALQGLLVLEASAMARDCVPYDKAVDCIEKLKGTGRIFFTIGNLEYLKHGGRIGKLTSIAGGILKIKPVLTLKEGEIINSGVARSSAKAQERVLSLLKDYLSEEREALKSYSFTLGFGYDYQEVLELKERFKVSFDKDNSFNGIPIMQIGATIGVHIGPNSLGIGIIKRYQDFI